MVSGTPWKGSELLSTRYPKRQCDNRFRALEHSKLDLQVLFVYDLIKRVHTNVCFLMKFQLGWAISEITVHRN